MVKMKKFLRRCKMQNWWPLFVRNLLNLKGVAPEAYAESRGDVLHCFIFHAFTWKATPEGGDFWARLDGWVDNLAEEIEKNAINE